MRVAISADGQTLTMRKGEWRMTCPACDLPKWIKFYTDMRDRNGGAYAEFYRDDLSALTSAQKRLSTM